MINQKTVNIVFFILLILLGFLSFSGVDISFYHYIIVIVIYFLIGITFSFFPGSGYFMQIHLRRKTDFKVIALTFDDGPHPLITPQILDILKNRAKATFFCIGKNIQGNEQIVKRIDAEGHIVGMHSFTHAFWFDLFSPLKMKKEFKTTEDILHQVLEKRPLFFRPPYGVINPPVKRALQSFPYHVIGFSNRSYDTTTNDQSVILERTIKQLNPGDIVLFHDTLEFAPELLNRFLNAVADKGYIIVGLDELLNITAYEE